MTGEESKAQSVFQDTIRESAARSAKGEALNDSLWFFRQARWRCLAASEEGTQAETAEVQEREVAREALTQLEHLEPEQLAIWISGAPEPQRSALALYYLDEFNYRDLASLLEVRVTELGKLIERGRRQFQAWLDAMMAL